MIDGIIVRVKSYDSSESGEASLSGKTGSIWLHAPSKLGEHDA